MMNPQPEYNKYGEVVWDKNRMFVPFKGDAMVSYPDVYSEWRYVEPFKARMRVVDTERGRSKMTIYLEDVQTGITYPMSFKDWEPLLMNHLWEQGLCGSLLEYTFKKSGANYLIIVVED